MENRRIFFLFMAPVRTIRYYLFVHVGTRSSHKAKILSFVIMYLIALYITGTCM